MNWKEHISSDSDILMGKPAIKETRLSIEFLIGRLTNGWTEQMLLDNYPRLTQQDLQAVFAYIQEQGVIFFRWDEFSPDEPANFLIELFKNKEITYNKLFTVIDKNNICQRKY